MIINVGITGASGSIYARILIDALCSYSEVSKVRVIITNNGKDVISYELGDSWLSDNDKVEVISNSDFYCSLASGSGGDDALVVVPCSVGMMSRIACGLSNDLISRGADVMLKERKRLILVIRENPLNHIHLENMVRLSAAGATILTANPSFYTRPATIEELCKTTVEVILRQLALPVDNRWG